MTQRSHRLTLSVSLTVLALVGASLAFAIGRSGSPTKASESRGVRLVFEARPTKRQRGITKSALERTIRLMRGRATRLGATRPKIERSGAKRITVTLSGVHDARRAARQLGATAQLSFYDWEPNILDETCRTDPSRVDGGQRAISGVHQAVKRASTCKAQGDDDVVVVRDEPAPNAKEGQEPDLWWVIRDNPVLEGTDIKNPEQNFDEQTNSPIVTMDFTDHGKDVFKRLTQAIVQRGSDNASPGSDVVSSSHHFAIRLDNELISTPYINYRENPEGIDGSNGVQISGGFTIQSAKDLADLLAFPALPFRMHLVSSSVTNRPRK